MLIAIGRPTARSPDRGRIRTIAIHRRFAGPRRFQLAFWALWLAGSGCTSLREIPRGEYGTQAERRDVRLVTREGLHYEFDAMRVEGDTLVGFKRRDVEGSIEEYASVHVALDDVGVLEVRRLDWLKTGLIGAGAAAVVVTAAVIRNRNDSSPESSGGGKNPIP
jgi:hypothetical protein